MCKRNRILLLIEGFVLIGLIIFTIVYSLKFLQNPEEDKTSGICLIILIWLYLISLAPALIQGYRYLMRMGFVQNMPIIFIFIFEIFAVVVFILAPVLALCYLREEYYTKKGIF